MKAKYYDSIDTAPILLFILISQGKKDTGALCYEGEVDAKDAANSWDKLYFEYVESFGVSSEYIHYTRERLALCEMLVGFYVDGEKWRRVLIDLKRLEIQKLEANMAQSETDFNTVLGRLSKRMGFGIDPNKTTIRQFYSYLKA